jgi:transposase
VRVGGVELFEGFTVARSVANRQGSSRRGEPSGRGTLGVSKPIRKRQKETLVEQQQQYVGIDLHRRRSVIVRMTETGEVLSTVQIENDPVALGMAMAEAGPDPEVALESTYGWYWAADLLQAEGARVHLVHPLGLHWDSRRVKNDVRDATALANRLRQNDLPESWIAPPAVREMREIVRYRAKLTALRTSAKAQIHAVMAKHGYLPELGDMFGPGGQALLDKMSFEGVYALRVESLRDLLEHYDKELTMIEREMRKMFKDHPGYRAIQAITGVGPVMAAIFCAEIGDVTRFPSARHLCSWAGVTPSVRDSDEKIRRGHITKQGSGLLRWAATEVVVRYHGGAPIAPTFRRIADRRGKMIARVAAARKLLTLVYYGLRDGQIRCLAPKEAS